MFELDAFAPRLSVVNRLWFCNGLSLYCRARLCTNKPSLCLGRHKPPDPLLRDGIISWRRPPRQRLPLEFWLWFAVKPVCWPLYRAWTLMK